MSSKLPTTTRALLVRPARSSQGKARLYDARLEEQDLRPLKKGELLVKINAVSFNHRDQWIRLGKYPAIGEGSPFGADGAGTVIGAADANDPLIRKRVFLVPMRGWEKDPDAPESPDLVIIGGSAKIPLGTFSEYVIVERDQVVRSPEHVDDEHLAAWPVAGTTAWRAAIVNGRVKAGDNVLITGIGGGVALVAMQLCLAKGAKVYVTSGGKEKIDSAVKMGATAGFNYKDADWAAQLGKALKATSKDKPLLDVIVDSGGGEIMTSTNKILKAGGRVVCYGMTAVPKITFTMREVLKNQQLIGSTMGSHRDIVEATKFMAEHRIVPTVSHVIDGLENAQEGFDLIKAGAHFGKVVVRIRHGREVFAKL
ncbi:NAD P-binding protein [Gloeophyllum trabeum ATCC 11539]|uniref:NAD P-binding protein n=1 Tax=Gloeophyllum trabeum (strain ATCC 11539 / FP-39264 / Madison 617) TaxID=670483 RepID=S7QES5_GLOTA|nr:NAD P-binding protein [Gloeophyllum trabeum ATCC 11539]EPQ57803.1 NAD P-binding protein [Gloeophyllum trabeum ATCC 11539]